MTCSSKTGNLTNKLKKSNRFTEEKLNKKPNPITSAKYAVIGQWTLSTGT